MKISLVDIPDVACYVSFGVLGLLYYNILKAYLYFLEIVNKVPYLLIAVTD